MIKTNNSKRLVLEYICIFRYQVSTDIKLWFESARSSRNCQTVYREKFNWLYLACCNISCSSPYVLLSSNPSLSSMIGVESDRFPFPGWNKVKYLWLIWIKRCLSWWRLPLASRLNLDKNLFKWLFYVLIYLIEHLFVFVSRQLQTLWSVKPEH